MGNSFPAHPLSSAAGAGGQLASTGGEGAWLGWPAALMTVGAEGWVSVNTSQTWGRTSQQADLLIWGEQLFGPPEYPQPTGYDSVPCINQNGEVNMPKAELKRLFFATSTGGLQRLCPTMRNLACFRCCQNAISAFQRYFRHSSGVHMSLLSCPKS